MHVAKPFLAFLTFMAMGGMTAAYAEDDRRLEVAIGEPGSDSFVFGTKLWALAQITLLPSYGIALSSREIAADSDRLALLQGGEVDAAVIYEQVSEADKGDLRAITALSSQGQPSESDNSAQLLVRKNTSDEIVYQITKVIFEKSDHFGNTQAGLAVGEPQEVMVGLDIPLHEGSSRYLEEVESSVKTASAGQGDPVRTPTVAIYRNFDDGALAPEEVDQIAAACRKALEMGALSAVLGDLSTTGCEVYQDRLAERGDPRGNDLRGSTIGQGGPAIRLAPTEGGTVAEDGDGAGVSPPRSGVPKPDVQQSIDSAVPQPTM